MLDSGRRLRHPPVDSPCRTCGAGVRAGQPGRTGARTAGKRTIVRMIISPRYRDHSGKIICSGCNRHEDPEQLVV